jgi:hypothetical protein
VSDIDTMIDRLSDRQRREFALWCAERVRPLMTDPRSTNALDVAARHLREEATDEELTAARAAARAAAWTAAAAAWAAAAVAWAAARHLRGEATDGEPAAANAANAAAWAAWAVRAASWDAAWDAEHAAQCAELERMLGEEKPISEPLPTDRVVSSVSLIWYAGLLESAARALETVGCDCPESEESPHQQLVRECREAAEAARFRARRDQNTPKS